MNVQYCRKPTREEIEFGYGCLHYIELPIETVIENGKVKKWVLIDDKRYYRV